MQRIIFKNPISLASFVGTALAVSVSSVNAQTTVYSQSFSSGTGVSLNGSAVPGGTGAGTLWQAGVDWLDNGTAGTLVDSSVNGEAAWLPFTPASGSIYTAQATILNDQPNWIGFGFLPATPPNGDWTASTYQVRHSNAGGYAWVLNRNSTGQSQQGFNGENTANQAFTGDLVDPTSQVTIKIVLDTTAATWTAQYFLNGAQQGSVFDLPSTANTGIGGIGFSHDRSSTANAGGMISDFSLTVVPEPTSVALFGLGGFLGLIAWMRRKIG